MRKRPIVIRYFVCEGCGSTMTAPKRKNKSTGVNHIKDMYCFVCKKETKFKQTF